MITWEVSYMVDPGDGIVSTATIHTESDDISNAIQMFYLAYSADHFVIGIRITSHPLMP